jgi:hypothetical protein
MIGKQMKKENVQCIGAVIDIDNAGFTRKDIIVRIE